MNYIRTLVLEIRVFTICAFSCLNAWAEGSDLLLLCLCLRKPDPCLMRLKGGLPTNEGYGAQFPRNDLTLKKASVLRPFPFLRAAKLLAQKRWEQIGESRGNTKGNLVIPNKLFWPKYLFLNPVSSDTYIWKLWNMNTYQSKNGSVDIVVNIIAPKVARYKHQPLIADGHS